MAKNGLKSARATCHGRRSIQIQNRASVLATQSKGTDTRGPHSEEKERDILRGIKEFGGYDGKCAQQIQQKYLKDRPIHLLRKKVKAMGEKAETKCKGKSVDDWSKDEMSTLRLALATHSEGKWETIVSQCESRRLSVRALTCMHSHILFPLFFLKSRSKSRTG